ncbi:NAD(P)H-hydrate dehydratase [Salinicoccus sp. HZC-1]|uniref:NAD(P)H-hydrate dehydratase n=1 Tax=Salinicoccus sp. HZC-1 TaxID=3385497 RepID=UPI00398A8A03
MRVVTGEEMKNVDQYTMDHIGIDGKILMENAGRAAAKRLMEDYAGQKFIVLIGSGNNGGDGFVIARTLLDSGFDVTVCVIPDKNKITGDAEYHKGVYEKSGYTWKSYDNSYLKDADIIVDTMLGTGVKGEIREPYLSIFKDISESKRKVVSIDLPSGVPSAEEAVSEFALKANHTIMLQQPKLSYYTYPARDYYGGAEVVQIGIPQKGLQAAVQSKRYEWTMEDTVNHWPKRSSSSHKGSHGKVGIIAGSDLMPGSAALSASAAVKSGAGLTTVNTVKSAIPVIASRMPEATFFDRGEDLQEFYAGKDAIAVGPGIGTDSGGQDATINLIDNFQAPLIIDADGLYQFQKVLPLVKNRESPLIITPHPGEMAKLIDSTPAKVNENRFSIAEKFARENGIYVVLKGPCTIVATPEGESFVNNTGNAGLAKGGSGDVLTGMILSFIARYDNIQTAISSAVYMHGFTADYLLEQGVAIESMTPSQIISHLETTFHMMNSMSQQ